MATQYDDGVFTTAAQHGDVVVSRPLLKQGLPDALVITRKMIVARSSYAPTALDVELSGFTGSKLVDETNFTDIGLDLIMFDQIYATIPGDWTEPVGSQIYDFPRYPGERTTLVKLSDVRISHTYQTGKTFTLPDLFQPTLAGFAVNYVSADTVPTITAYKSDVTAGNFLTIDAQPVQYMGNIYEIRVTEIRAK